MTDRDRAKKILEILKKSYPNAKISLTYKNNFELLVAVMLSAQTTDKQVNKVTGKLFPKYRKGKNEREEIENFANASLKTLQKDIKSIGLYKTKAKNIKEMSTLLLTSFDARVPDSMSELLTLPGVGRKTANVILSNAFKKNVGVAVDTHVRRLALELRLTKEKNPIKIEKDLMSLFDRKAWGLVTNLLISHGRKKDKKVDLLLGKV